MLDDQREQSKFRCDEPLYKSVHEGRDVVTKKGTGSGTSSGNETLRSPAAPMVLCGRVSRVRNESDMFIFVASLV